MCLLLGATGVGKTLLMKRLETVSSKSGNDYKFDDVPATIPTVGTNLVTVNLRRQGITVREVGGCMGPIWKNYFKECTALMYMIDLSNRIQVATSCIQLLSVLSSERMSGIPVLLIYNKIDMPSLMTRSEIESMFRLDEIISNCSQKIHQVDLSAYSGKGIRDVIKWLEQNCSGK